jgi:hypothetical protein
VHKCGVAQPGGGFCPALVDDGLLFDAPHWRLVPAELQRRVWRAWNDGQPPDPGAHAAVCAEARQAVEAELLDQAAGNGLTRARQSGRARRAGRTSRRAPRSTTTSGRRRA